jgi:membrane-bound metal-dependent hydrolase YbcI (DUF457 family)
MAGLTTHLTIALIGGLIILLSFKQWKWGLGFFIGQLAPDSIRFGITGLVNHTLDFGQIIAKPLYWTLAFTHYYYVWTLVFASIFGILYLLLKKKKINKKQFKEWFIADAVLLSAVILHLIVDKFIIEKSFWI